MYNYLHAAAWVLLILSSDSVHCNTCLTVYHAHLLSSVKWMAVFGSTCLFTLLAVASWPYSLPHYSDLSFTTLHLLSLILPDNINCVLSPSLFASHFTYSLLHYKRTCFLQWLETSFQFASSLQTFLPVF